MRTFLGSEDNRLELGLVLGVMLHTITIHTHTHTVIGCLECLFGCVFNRIPQILTFIEAHIYAVKEQNRWQKDSWLKDIVAV